MRLSFAWMFGLMVCGPAGVELASSGGGEAGLGNPTRTRFDDVLPGLPPANRLSDEALVEAAIQSKGLTAPRVTIADIDAAIVGADYHVFDGTTLTVCCLQLRNGFTVTGESACVSPENFNPALGREIAYANARNKIWSLEGYRLRHELWSRNVWNPATAQTVPGDTGTPGT
jgi:hypothetical protein